MTADDTIRNKIHTIRGVKVMLDRDLAELYGVETKALNQAVKRNMERFPEHFMFRLTDEEYNSLRFQNGTLEKNEILRFQNGTSSSLRSQIVTLENGRGKHRKYLPYVFTEQGVSMLSGVLSSKTAVKVSIQIMTAFVTMRRFISKNAQIFGRLDSVEQKQIAYQLKTDENFEKIFDAMGNKEFTQKQGIFYDGQIFDAYKFISDLIRRAKSSIILIDNYVDDSVLTLFSKRKKNVNVVIYTKNITKQLKLDLKKYNSQYNPIEIKEFKNAHDRFLIIDDKEVYHIGASLKDLGRKWFAFSKFDKKALDVISRLNK
jgi:hypothetical protein